MRFRGLGKSVHRPNLQIRSTRCLKRNRTGSWTPESVINPQHPQPGYDVRNTFLPSDFTLVVAGRLQSPTSRVARREPPSTGGQRGGEVQTVRQRIMSGMRKFHSFQAVQRAESSAGLVGCEFSYRNPMIASHRRPDLQDSEGRQILTAPPTNNQLSEVSGGVEPTTSRVQRERAIH